MARRSQQQSQEPEPKQQAARWVTRGTIVKPKGGNAETGEVVRDVSVVLHLANGQDEVYPANDEVTILPPEDLQPPEVEV